MADIKIDGLAAIAAVLDGSQFETDTGGVTANKATGLQIKTYVLLNRVIGTDIQAFDVVLEDLAALSAVADNEFIVGTGAGTYAHESGATVRTSMGVAIGTDVQAFDAVLDDLSALSVVADNEIIVGTGAGVYANESGTTLRTSIGCKKVGLETLWVPATSMTPATTSGAATGQHESTTNKVNIEVLDFDTAADEFAHFTIAFPKSWDEGTVTFNAVWTAATGGTTGVAIALQGVALSDNESIDTAYGTAVVVTDDAQTGAHEKYLTATSAAVTIGNSPAEGDIINFRVFRDVSDANDDLAEDMRLIGINVFFTLNAEDDT